MHENQWKCGEKTICDKSNSIKQQQKHTYSDEKMKKLIHQLNN